jgi:TatD DNase family protein
MIDTHTHLTDTPLYEKLDSVLTRARNAGVTRYVIPGYTLPSWRRAAQIAAEYEGVFFAVGVHPLFMLESAAEDIQAYVNEDPVIAVGEIGLDYVDAEGDTLSQQALFRCQMQTALDVNLPVILHCRRAHDDLLAICREFPGVSGVLHSCSCSHEQVKPFLDLGYYVGFSGVVTRPRAKKAKKLAEYVPVDRILTETDSPFIGTQQHRPPTTEPAHIPEIVSALARIRKTTCEEIEQVTEKNAATLFDKSLFKRPDIHSAALDSR